MRLPVLGLILLLAGLLFSARPAGCQSQPGDIGAPAADSAAADNTGAPAPQPEAGPATPEPAAPTLPVLPAPAARPNFPNSRPLPGGGIGPERPGSARNILLDVRGLSIDVVLKILSEATGLTVVKDPDLDVQLTIICPRQVTVDEALEILNAELSVINYTTVRQGNVLKVTSFENAAKINTEIHMGTDANAFAPGDRFITQIVPLQSLDAATTADELGNYSTGSIVPNLATNTLYISDTASNVQKMLGIINEMEKRSAASVRRFPLKYVAAEEIADLLSDYLTGVGGGGGGTTANRPGYERRLQPTRNQPTNRPVATPRPSQPAAATAGGSGIQVLTDARTNSLIVQASPERLEATEHFLAAIDVPVDYSSTLAVIPVKYARVDMLANRLIEVLGGTPKTTSSNTPSSSRTSSGSSSSGNYRTSGTGTTAAFVPDATPSQTGPGVVLAQGNSDAAGNILPIQSQTTGTTPVGRTGEGRVVPLIDMTDIVIVPDPATGSLIVNASPEKLELVKQLVQKLDVTPTQVMVQAVIAEVTLSKTNQLGIEWKLNGNNSLGTGIADTLSTAFGMQQKDSSGNDIPLLGLSWSVGSLLKGDRFEGLLNAMRQDSNVRILSTPRIFAYSGETSTINVSTQVPFAKGTLASDTGSISTSFDYQPVGIVLEVTPSVSQDGLVSMAVSQTADDLLRYDQISPDLKLPVVAKRLVESTGVSVQDGDTAVLGGLMQDRITRSVTGIPLLKDLPLVGWAFRNKNTIKEKTELLVFLTPYVLRTPEETRMFAEREKAKSLELKNMPICPTGPEH